MDTDTGPVPLPPLTAPVAAQSLARSMSPTQRLRHALPAYVPVLLMAALAATTGWLARHTPVPEPERTAAAPSDEPDYQMRGFSVQRYAGDGAARAVIEGDDTRHYADDDRLEIDGARLRWVPLQGPALSAQATHAVARGAESQVRLDGRVRVWREASAENAEPLEFHGEEITLDLKRGQASSERPVELRQGESVFTAASMRYDHAAQTLTLTGGVKGTLRRQADAR